MIGKNQYFLNYCKEKNVVCDCGGPQYGTDHSPDCEINLAWDTALELYFDELYEEENTEAM